MKRTDVMFGMGALAWTLTGCGSLTKRDCGACCKGVGFIGVAAHAWEGGE